MIDCIIKEFVSILKDNCVGIYLHGSKAMGCFQPKRSDIDFLVVVKNMLKVEEKGRLLDCLLQAQKKASGKAYEMSIVLEKYCHANLFPTPFEFHFSKAYEQEAMNNGNSFIEKMVGNDWDLAAHFMVIYHRGITLYGKPILEVFSEVPKKYYLQSLYLDFKDYKNNYKTNFYYYILNGCRIHAYIKDGLILSKMEGGYYYLENEKKIQVYCKRSY